MKWSQILPPQIPEELISLPLNPVILKLLVQRGFSSEESVKKFLESRYEHLHSPHDLKGVDEAVERIKISKQKKERLVIYGDYDADGITSTAILKEALQAVGLRADSYIPDRNKEGYGLNNKALDFIKSEYDADLLITVDCGTSNVEEIKYAGEKGMDVIVIDHHSIPKDVPKKCILINPKLPNQKYPFKELAGVGVVFKFVEALWEEMIPKKKPFLKWFLDLVAIGTIADCVPLVDENRIFAKFGLIVLQKTKRLGVQEIIKTARLNINEKNPPNVENVAYQIGPRFNAAGRMDHADLALNLLIEKDQVKARIAALEIESKNCERQKITQQILAEIKETLKPDENYKLIIRKGRHWPIGILGIVAGRITDEYRCPVFILRESDEIIQGSGRSVEAFNIFSAVSQLDNLIEKFGGHSQAMGLKIKPGNIEEFEKKLAGIIEKEYDEDKWGKRINIDAELPADEIDWDIFSDITKLEPFGEGNREPILLSRGMKILEAKLVGNGQKHIKFVFEVNGGAKIISGIFFKGGDYFSSIEEGSDVSVVYNLRSNTWNGNRKLDLNIIDLKKEE